MANYASLKAAIQQAVKTNGNNEITGALLQQTLFAMVNSLGGYYQFAGIATSTTNPGTPDQNVFYIASTAGTYSNFGGLVLADGEIAILKWNGVWSKDSTGAATQESVNKLGIQITNNGYIKPDGNVHPSSVFNSWLYSNLIPVKIGMKFHLYGCGSNAVLMIAFYDKNEIFISGISGQSATTQYEVINGVVPENAEYLRVCLNVGTELNPYYYSFTIENYASEESLYLLQKINGSLYDVKIDSFPNDGYFNVDGSVSVTYYWKYTGYILVMPGGAYTINNYHAKDTTPIVIFYDEELNILQNGIIGVSEETGMTTYRGTIPDGAKYARICTRIQDVASSFFQTQINISYILSIVKKNTSDIAQYANTIETLTNDVDRLNRKTKHFTSFVDKPFSFSGKTAAFFGDSITNGVASDPLRAIENCYRKVLCDTLGLTGTNYAISGTYICDPTDDQESITNRILSQITQSNIFDFVFIMGGTNDYWTGKPLGQLGDSTKATFYGSLKVICEHLAATIPSTTKVVFFVPINCSRYQTSAVATIESYRQAIYEIASMYGYNVVDTSDICFPDKYMPTNIYWQTMIADGVHPTELGHKILGKNLAAKLL